MEKAHNIKGIRIRTLNTVMLVLAIILFMIVFYTTYQITEEYQKSLEVTKNFLNWNEAERTVSSGTTYLTDQVRLYVQTHNKKYADNFFRELFENRRREKALEFLSNHDLHLDKDGEECHLKSALDLSNILGMRETYAIRLVAEGTRDDLQTFHPIIRQTRLTGAHRLMSPEKKFALAREMVFGSEYQHAKNEIAEQLNQFAGGSVQFINQEQVDQSLRLGKVLSEQKLALVVLFVLIILTFAMIITLIIKPLQVYLNCIKNDQMLEMIGAYEFKHLAFTYNDIFTLKEHHEKIMQYKAEHDQLTGMLNRNALESIKELLKDSAIPVGVVLIDVDHFKGINDTWGHAVGDEALRRVSTMLQQSFRSEDFCVRLGGDEFMIIVKGRVCEKEDIIKNKIMEINNELQNPPKDFPKLSLSVGVAVSDKGLNDDLIAQADLALYKVKEAGRCGCQFYHPDTETKGTPDE